MNQDNVCREVQKLLKIVAIFGLKIHIGKGEVKPETKFVCFWPSSWFNPQNQLGSGSNPITTMKERKRRRSTSDTQMGEHTTI